MITYTESFGFFLPAASLQEVEGRGSGTCEFTENPYAFKQLNQIRFGPFPMISICLGLSEKGSLNEQQTGQTKETKVEYIHTFSSQTRQEPTRQASNCEPLFTIGLYPTVQGQQCSIHPERLAFLFLLLPNHRIREGLGRQYQPNWIGVKWLKS